MKADPATSDKSRDEAREIKEKIIEAASRLYEEKGLYETSVAEIAELAGISVPVTYHYVTRKSDILLLIMEAFAGRFKERVRPPLEGLTDPVARLKTALRSYYTLVDEQLIKVVLVYRQSRALDKAGRAKVMAAETETAKVFSDILQEGMDQGAFKRLDPDLVAYNVLTIGHAWALKNWHFRHRLSLDEYIGFQTDFILTAIRA
ncbi:MAG: TetR/AcrR family transcriptional regulator [Thermodesulfobacteriota bacterium]